MHIKLLHHTLQWHFRILLTPLEEEQTAYNIALRLRKWRTFFSFFFFFRINWQGRQWCPAKQDLIFTPKNRTLSHRQSWKFSFTCKAYSCMLHCLWNKYTQPSSLLLLVMTNDHSKILYCIQRRFTEHKSTVSWANMDEEMWKCTVMTSAVVNLKVSWTIN